MSIGYIAYEKGDSLQEALAKVDDSLYDVKRLYKEKKLRQASFLFAGDVRNTMAESLDFTGLQLSVDKLQG